MMNVIVVDDELLMRIGLKSMINWEEHGFQIIGEAANGKEALEMARLHPPDLIITDIKMPVMDGLALIREASSFLDNCQYVILSCLDEFQFAKEALRLGAVDYLIKSDMKPQQLLDVLGIVRKKIEQSVFQGGAGVLKQEYKESLGFLKEKLFKELFSGFCQEEEAIRRSEALRISLVQGPMALVKLRVRHFEDIRQKYIEQDEKLLRYSITNIMEEIIPRRWNKEIVALTSADYVFVINIPELENEFPREELDKLLKKISAAMKDFLNITLDFGVSGCASSFSGLRKAYQEADIALKSLFFEEKRDIFFFEPEQNRLHDRHEAYHLSREEERAFRDRVENDGKDCDGYLRQLKERLRQESVSEQDIRKVYIHLLSQIGSCFPSTPNRWNEGRTPYEQLLIAESLDELHELISRFLEECLEYNRSQDAGMQSYAEQACAMIRERFNEDISLQSIAEQINVNPSYLSRVFKRETGVNFVNYLTRVRMEKAKFYLRSKCYKVYEVAEKVGYPNTAYFSKLFKKVNGITPEDYRG